MFFTTALLQSASANGANPMMMNIALLGGIVFLFYFLLVRPQNKARKALEEKLSKLKSGDEVLLTSGFYATVDRVDGNLLYLKLGGSIVKARRNAVAALASEYEGTTTSAAN
ncbi:MAG: preprotein translocase subunit YajC [Holophagales bacterium]|jgi:preprotein translocase subunit YajC|nr:preprotein translocase subunit YajC [Holophagales bacterium]